MKEWINKVLGRKAQEPINTDLNALDDYVVVKKKDLDGLIAELQDLRGQNISTDARELDMMVANLELENKKLKMDVEVLTSALRDATMKSPGN
jgi:hypothetical protein